MAYADAIRISAPTMEQVATLIEGIQSADYPLTWQSWTPTLSASGSMTWTSTTIHYAKYLRIGKLVIFVLQASGTTGGTASNALRFTYPISNTVAVIGLGCGVADGGAPLGGAFSGVSSTVGQVARYDNANLGLGGGRYLYCQGFYEVA